MEFIFATCLQALLDHTQNGLSAAQIVLVISNKSDVQGLQRAQKAGVPTKVCVWTFELHYNNLIFCLCISWLTVLLLLLLLCFICCQILAGVLFHQVISHKGYKTRLEFDTAVTEVLKEAGIELICLAGFMRILTGEFVRTWQGRLLNIHPSLLPSFKGMHAQRQALEAGVTLTGCTVHFVAVRSCAVLSVY